MYKAWSIALLLFAFLLTVGNVAEAQNNVTFNVRMSIKMLEGSFLPGSGDIVRVAGSFNDWGNSLDTLRDIGTVDSIYEKTVSLPAGQIQYKYLKTLRGGLDWEGGDNRTHDVVAGNQTVSLAWFDHDSIYTPPANANVTFRVNMRVKMLEGTFRPDSGDIVRVAGSFNDWGNSLDTLRDAIPTDSIYQKTVSLTVGQNVQYKFLKTPNRGGLDWEGGDNRTYTVEAGDQTLPVVWFDYDSVVSVPVSGNVTYRVDMRALQQIGWFVPPGDTVQARGGFNSWGGTAMSLSALTGLYQLTLPYNGFSGEQSDYKFFLQLNPATAETRFPGFSTNNDGVQYDHPYTRGDGNRRLTFPQVGGNFNTDPFYFSDIHRFGTMNNTTDTCRVTISVNMGPATRYIDPFILGTDTLYLQWQDQAWVFNQVGNQGGAPFPLRRLMTRNGPTDSIYSTTFKVQGRTYYGMMYNYEYVHAGGGSVSEGGGLGTQNPYRSRFIQPTAANTFPATYSAPVDQWQKAAPLPAEVPPYGITNVREDNAPGIPVVYTLNQNYPNPFNPSTRIKYSIPENAKVTLRVYNLLGQQVAELVNQEQTRGNYVALFEGQSLASGVYFYRLETKNFTETKKMVLMK
ncbi:MAG: T9SS type A sorting domain-containing protein [Bacteroidetes bacterium]|nr:T9SS type A sorting domain-containing protein [Bacteroidota bacterium]MCW5896025.1 T9SS type A sorting domain-containing protein [Bacteroidota bacterium]